MSRGRDIDDRDEDWTGREPKPEPSTSPSPKPDHARDSDDRGRAGGGPSELGSRFRDLDRDDERPEGLDDMRQSYRFRDRSYWLKAEDFETMREIGRFRALTEDDLTRFRFAGNEARTKYELGVLAKQGLIRRHVVGNGIESGFHACVQTRDGNRLIERLRRPDEATSPDRQVFYADLKKPTEACHDTAIYRMYQAEAARIRGKGRHDSPRRSRLRAQETSLRPACKGEANGARDA